MKLCGCKEPCFVNGEKVWNRYGNILCYHASEKKTCTDRSIGSCSLTNERVLAYLNQKGYEMICAKFEELQPVLKAIEALRTFTSSDDFQNYSELYRIGYSEALDDLENELKIQE